MLLGLEGKNAIITGGSHGIGLATAKLLASEGCNVALLSRDLKKLQKAKQQISEFNVNC